MKIASRVPFVLLLAVAAPAAAPAQRTDTTHARPTVATAERRRATQPEAARRARLIRSALAAGPRSISEHAAVIAPNAEGKMEELRPGTNGWTCMPDQPQSPGLDPMCLDPHAMKWAQSLMNHEATPANTSPGIVYMLQGGSDISATDPWQEKTDHFVASPPHWMIVYPFDAAQSGLPTTPKKSGAWIMWAGTPYAHVMINQVP